EVSLNETCSRMGALLRSGGVDPFSRPFYPKRSVGERECGFLMVPRLLRIAGIGAVVVIVATAPANYAWADPSVQELEKQIDAAWNTLEPVIEQYNKVHAQLTANQAKAAELQRRIQPLQAQVDAAMANVSEMAVRVYKAGSGSASTLNAVLSG